MRYTKETTLETGIVAEENKEEEGEKNNEGKQMKLKRKERTKNPKVLENIQVCNEEIIEGEEKYKEEKYKEEIDETQDEGENKTLKNPKIFKSVMKKSQK